MNRRTFMAGLSSVGAVWPLRCYAQSPTDDTRPERDREPRWSTWKERPSIVTVSENDDPRLRQFMKHGISGTPSC
jgi:hypothetical protein